jgi:DNA-binding FadR family transcriptional regulator
LAIDHATARGGDGVEEDLAFHVAIGRATANAYWSQFVRLFAEQMRLAIGVTRANEARRLDLCAAVADEHRSIYQAILDASADRARAAVHRHLINAAARITGADSDFWREEGRDVVAAWARQQVATRED